MPFLGQLTSKNCCAGKWEAGNFPSDLALVGWWLSLRVNGGDFLSVEQVLEGVLMQMNKESQTPGLMNVSIFSCFNN